MKKSLILAALLIGAGSAQAQLTSKKGEAYLPAAGDWSFGIDATPFLTYMGGFLSGTGAVAPTQNFLNSNQTIIGKYFKSDNMAYRGILRIGMNSKSYSNSITQTGATATFPNLPAQVEDTYKEKSSNIGLGGGLEWRRGSTRLQGYYGGDVMISFISSGRSYTYGNALTTTGAVQTDWALELPGVGGAPGAPTNIETIGGGAYYRNTEVKDGGTFAFTLRGFAGAEYFVLPKISIAAEFGWGMSIASKGGSSTSREGVGATAAGVAIGSNTLEGSGTGSFSIDTDRNLTGTTSGALRLNFHF